MTHFPSFPHPKKKKGIYIARCILDISMDIWPRYRVVKFMYSFANYIIPSRGHRGFRSGLQYFTRQCATPPCVPLVLAGVNRGYPVYSMLYNTSRISGPKEEWIGLMWPVECARKPVLSQFLRPFAT